MDLTADASERLEDVGRIELGFPHDFLGAGFTQDMIRGDLVHRIDARAHER